MDRNLLCAAMSRRAWALFLGVSFLWGIPYFLIKVAVDDGVPPVFLAWVRVALGAVLLSLVCWRLGLFEQLCGRWRLLAVYALVEIVVPFPLIAAGEQEVSSSLAAILVASVPLMIAALAIRFDAEERAEGWRLVGLVVGFGGVVALVGLDVAGDSRELLGAAAILLAAFGYAIGAMIVKLGMGDVDPRATMAGALVLAAVLLTPGALLAPPEGSVSGEAIAALIGLGVFCTAAAFVLFGMLILEVGPSRASVITYVAPAVAVLCGVVLLDESLGVGAIAGMFLIIAGSWLSTRRRTTADVTGAAG
jgi:drug/metabolite transporter (DMT)-like permease